jgi:uncharacterized iron-regulated protein
MVQKEIKEIYKKLDKVMSLLESRNQNSLDDFISESDAKKLLTRGTTWFWTLRKQGLPYTRLGNQVYYKKKDLYAYLDSNLKGGHDD